jgi:hypothetical protein
MNVTRLLAVICLAALVTPLCFADPDKPLPDAPAVGLAASGSGGHAAAVLEAPGFRPLSSLAIGVKVGAEGVGFDVATPLNRRVNLRAGASFFSYAPSRTENGIGLTGSLTFRTANACLDFYPTGRSFRISPGVTFYNGNRVTANATVGGNQTFTLDGTTYYSSTTDPVSGTFGVGFGNQVAPSITMGWGNMIPRGIGRHWSVPYEIGFEYINTPTIALNLTGSACQKSNNTNCQPVQSTPSVQANVVGERAELQSDISMLRFFPIVSIGVAYKFGR